MKQKVITISLLLCVIATSFTLATSVFSLSLGDLNNDNKINAADCNMMNAVILGIIGNDDLIARGDINHDSKVNAIDLSLLTKYIVGEYEIEEEEEDTLTLKTLDSSITVDPTESGLLITSLKTNAGEETVLTPYEYPLPKSAYVRTKANDIVWTYTGQKNTSGTDSGTKYKELQLTYINDKFNLQYVLHIKACPNVNGPFEIYGVLSNKSEENSVRIQPRTIASFNIPSGGDFVTIKKESGMAEGYIHYGSGSASYPGTGIYRKSATGSNGVTAWTNTYQNWNESGFIPIVFLDNRTSGAYCAFESSSGRVYAQNSANGTTTFSVDLDKVGASKVNFTTTLSSNSSMTFPSVYIGVYDGSLDDGSNILKNWLFDCKVPEKLRNDPNEPLSQMDMQTGLEGYGVESIKWDYGWWSNTRLGSWCSLEGSWEIRNSAYLGVLDIYNCKTMSEFGALAKSRGLNWTTYLLLHDTLDDNGNPTDEYGEFNSVTHPEWFSSRRIAENMGSSADLGNEECVEYLKEHLVNYFNNNNVSTWRSDFEPISYYSDNINRHEEMGSDVMYWCSVGFKDIIQYLYDNVDGFRYESCSSGGSMKDFFTSTLAVSINTDDSANYLSLRMSFYDSSYALHPTQLQMPINIDYFNIDCNTLWPNVTTSNPNRDEFKKAMLDMGFRTLCIGSPMFSSSSVTILTDYYEKYSEMYKNKIRPLVRDGDLYHILPRPDGVNYDGIMYTDVDSENDIKGLVFLFKPSEEAGNTCHITMNGLDENKIYDLTFEDRHEQNCTASGKSLMTDGIDVEIQYIGSELIWISEH